MHENSVKNRTPEERIAELERRLRRFCWEIGVCVALLAATVCLLSPLSRRPLYHEALMARRLFILDQHGKPALQMGPSKNGAIGLHFTDEKGADRLRLGVLNDGQPCVEMLSSGGSLRYVARLYEHDRCVLSVLDEKGKAVCVLGENKSGAGDISIRTATGGHWIFRAEPEDKASHSLAPPPPAVPPRN